MINRVLIRIKVVQMLYSYLLTQKERSLIDAKEELQVSLSKAYELYHALLVLMIDLTRMQELKLDYAKNKYLPTDEEKNPNTRFIDNRLIEALRNNEDLNGYLKENPISWQDDVYLHILLDKITQSEYYTEYMSLEKTTFEIDCEFWRNILKKVIFSDDDFSEFLESKSVYWNDDLVSISTFLLKTIKRWADGEKQKLMPMYKDEEDSNFAETLFSFTVNNKEEYDKLIDRFINTDSWDVERVAFMDRIILDCGIAELLNFKKIPTTVTLNEYIDIAKYYSTNKSGTFVNGIFDSIIKYLKKEKTLTKE
ncbi:MAG: transcription antitermination factor NusB [Muribaculaceae bacterium]|nr:transcription antitermination factor NusB [Muribaculaceae bacterium]